MTESVPSKPRVDVHREITSQIVKAIEAGAGEYVMPWHYVGIGHGRPANALTGKRYRGANVIALWAAGMLAAYNMGYWATYRQWRALGAQVRRGQAGTMILFYKELDVTAHEDAEAERRFVARASYVFNADQVEGWSPPEPEFIGAVEAARDAEALIAASGARIRQGGNVAKYDILDDYIQVPEPIRFKGSPTSTPTESYYATLLHELTHWTGAKHRLDRQFGRYGSEAYAAEELVAEFGAALLCADLEIANDPRPDHAAYLAGWLRLLKEKPKALFEAAREASRAVEFLFGLGGRGE